MGVVTLDGLDPGLDAFFGRLILQLSVKVTGSFLRFGTFSKFSCVLRSPNDRFLIGYRVDIACVMEEELSNQLY